MYFLTKGIRVPYERRKCLQLFVAFATITGEPKVLRAEFKTYDLESVNISTYFRRKKKKKTYLINSNN